MSRVVTLHNWLLEKHCLNQCREAAPSMIPILHVQVAGDDPVHKTGFNHYSDGCLYQAGGRNRGVMDFIQFHNHPWAGQASQLEYYKLDSLNCRKLGY